jgi:hypothetical protein
VFTILVAQAADAATAKAEWNTQLAVIETKLSSGLPPSVHVSLDTSSLSGVGDAAVSVSGGDAADGINFNGVYVLSGPTFFLIGDLVLNQPPASIDDLKTQAQTVLGRI